MSNYGKTSNELFIQFVARSTTRRYRLQLLLMFSKIKEYITAQILKFQGELECGVFRSLLLVKTFDGLKIFPLTFGMGNEQNKKVRDHSNNY